MGKDWFRPVKMDRFMISLDKEMGRDRERNRMSLQPRSTKSIFQSASVNENYPQLQEEDFFMAIKGVTSAITKLDKQMLLEIKHLQKSGHLEILADLIVKAFHLKGMNTIRKQDFAVNQLIQSGKLREFLTSLEPKSINLRLAHQLLLTLQRNQYFAQVGGVKNDQGMANIPKSLKLLHKYLACTCLITVGTQAHGYS